MRRKPVWLTFPLVLLTTALTAGAVDFYQSNFQGWRDNSTNPGFNASLTPEGAGAKLKVVGAAKFGKVMSPEEGISMKVTPTLILQVALDTVPTGAVVNIEVTNATPPYDAHKVLSGISKPGVYNVSLGRMTAWNGTKNFWITLWVENTSSPVTLSKLRIGENLVEIAPEVKAEAKPTVAKNNDTKPTDLKAGDNKNIKSEATPTVVPTPDPVADFRGDTSVAYQYFENWASGLNGWQDDAVDKGSNVVATPKKSGRLFIKLKEKVFYGKFSSPKKAIVVDLAAYPYFEIELEREFEQGSMKVQFIQARNRDNFRTVIPQFSRRGVYVVNVPEATGWNEKEAFFIEIWLEGTNAQATISAIGFAKKMSAMQGLFNPVMSVNPAEVAPDKNADILKVSGVADQTFRGVWTDGLLSTQKYPDGSTPSAGHKLTVPDRYGFSFLNVGYSEIAQKMYLNTAITPMKDTEIYASLGYDMVNAIDGTAWEDPYGNAINPKWNFALLRFQDFYAGNMFQLGSVYDPMFTDNTLKKASSGRGFLWKPKLNDLQFKFVGTRLYTTKGDYKDNIYLLGARVTNFFNFSAGSLRLGLTALNLSKSNGEMDGASLQGKVDSDVYKKYVPSVYVKVENLTDQTVYYNNNQTNSIRITGTDGTVINADLTPPTGNDYIYDKGNAYIDPNNAVGMNKTGYIIYRVPLVNSITGELLEPGQIASVGGNIEAGAVLPRTTSTVTGQVRLSVSSDASHWLTDPSLIVFNQSGYTSGSIIPNQTYNCAAVLAALKTGEFDQTEGTNARSVLGVDVNGQIFGINLDAELDTSIAHNQTFQGKRVNRQASMYFVKASRGFSGAMVKAAVYKVSPDYDTSLQGYNAVDDNDNGSKLPDGFKDKSGVVFGDYSNRGVPDKEYTVGLYVPQDYMLTEVDDRNHNGILDSRENDHEPDYTYRRDQQGYDFSVFVPRQVLEGTLASNLEAELRAQNVKRISAEGHNQTIDFQLNYIKTDIEDVFVKAGMYVANISDTLSTQYNMYSPWDVTITTTDEYKNNFVVSPSLQVNYDTPWGLKAMFLDRYRVNQRFQGEKTTDYGNEAVVDVRYKHYLLDAWSITPVYVGMFNATRACIGTYPTNWCPIYNTYYIPADYKVSGKLDIPVVHQFYLKNSYPILNQYNLAVDFGREIQLRTAAGKPDLIKDSMGLGIMRNIPRGFVRLQYELSKWYYPYDEWMNSGQGALWAQVTVSF